MQSINFSKYAKIGSIAISIVLLLLGTWLLIEPAIIWKFKNLCAITFFAFGLVKLLGYASKDLYQLAFQYDFEIGLLLCLIGILVGLHSSSDLTILYVAFGICVVVDSLFKMRISYDAKEFGIPTWWITILLACGCAILGIILTFRPILQSISMIRLLGISFLLEGFTNLQTMITMVKIYKAKPSNQINNV